MQPFCVPSSLAIKRCSHIDHCNRDNGTPITIEQTDVVNLSLVVNLFYGHTWDHSSSISSPLTKSGLMMRKYFYSLLSHLNFIYSANKYPNPPQRDCYGLFISSSWKVTLLLLVSAANSGDGAKKRWGGECMKWDGRDWKSQATIRIRTVTALNLKPIQSAITNATAVNLSAKILAYYKSH